MSFIYVGTVDRLIEVIREGNMSLLSETTIERYKALYTENANYIQLEAVYGVITS